MKKKLNTLPRLDRLSRPISRRDQRSLRALYVKAKAIDKAHSRQMDRLVDEALRLSREFLDTSNASHTFDFIYGNYDPDPDIAVRELVAHLGADSVVSESGGDKAAIGDGEVKSNTDDIDKNPPHLSFDFAHQFVREFTILLHMYQSSYSSAFGSTPDALAMNDAFEEIEECFETSMPAFSPNASFPGTFGVAASVLFGPDFGGGFHPECADSEARDAFRLAHLYIRATVQEHDAPSRNKSIVCDFLKAAAIAANAYLSRKASATSAESLI